MTSKLNDKKPNDRELGIKKKSILHGKHMTTNHMTGKLCVREVRELETTVFGSCMDKLWLAF